MTKSPTFAGTAEAPQSTMPRVAVISKTAELYLWDREDCQFLKQADVLSTVNSRSSGHDYWITATTDVGQQLISHKISSELNVRWSTKLFSATWDHTSRAGHLSSWCLKFEGPQSCKEFQEAYSACLLRAAGAASRQRHLAQGKSNLS